MARGLVGAAGKASLDMAMAVLAAVSVGFVTFAMPDAVFSDLIGRSGLPALLPAAEPPLGQTARLASVAVAAIGAFLLAWLVLRALGQKPVEAKPSEARAEPSLRRRSFEAAAEPPAEAPRIRRADAHPDAPSRRPLFAGSDLGEPLDEIDVSDHAGGEWIDPIDDEQAEGEPLPAFMAEEAAPVEDETEAYEQAGSIDDDDADADLDAESEEEDEDLSAYASLLPGTRSYEPQPDEDQSDDSHAIPDEYVPVDEPSPCDAQSYYPPSPPEEATIAELMQRLERGLQRRGEAESDPAPVARTMVDLDVPPPEAAAQPEAFPAADPQMPIDDRLRSALDDLQKMASRTAQG